MGLTNEMWDLPAHNPFYSDLCGRVQVWRANGGTDRVRQRDRNREMEEKKREKEKDTTREMEKKEGNKEKDEESSVEMIS